MSRAVLDANRTGFARRGDGTSISWGVDSADSRRALNKAYLARLQLREGEVTVVDISSASYGRYQGKIFLLGPGAEAPGIELPEGAKLVFDEEHVFSAAMSVDRSHTRDSGVEVLSRTYGGYVDGTERVTSLARARFVASCACAFGGVLVVLGAVLHSIASKEYLSLVLGLSGVLAIAVGAVVYRYVVIQIRRKSGF